MTTREFFLLLLVIFLGVLAALGVAALYAKQQLAATANSSPLGTLLSL